MDGNMQKEDKMTEFKHWWRTTITGKDDDF
jgi:hypothetical protein